MKQWIIGFLMTSLLLWGQAKDQPSGPQLATPPQLTNWSNEHVTVVNSTRYLTELCANAFAGAATQNEYLVCWHRFQGMTEMLAVASEYHCGTEWWIEPADFRSEVLGVGGDLQQSRGAATEQQIVDNLLVL